MGKRTAQKDTITDTGEQQFPIQMVTGLPNIDNYFLLILDLYITGLTINNNIPHLKSPKNQNRRAALGRQAMKLLGGFNEFAVDQHWPFVLFTLIRQNNYEQQNTNEKQSGQLVLKGRWQQC